MVFIVGVTGSHPDNKDHNKAINAVSCRTKHTNEQSGCKSRWVWRKRTTKVSRQFYVIVVVLPETNALLNTRLEGFTKALTALGIPAADVYVDMVNFLPKYEYDISKKLFSKKTYTEIPKGFEMQKNVHIRYANPALLERIVTAAAAQEIYDIVKVDYFVKDAEGIYSELRETTFAYLQKIIKQYKTLGIELDSAYTITAENAWVAYPINRYESYRAFSTQRLDFDENSKVNSADKVTSRFYNAVPANDYDIVINPEILEPAVQFSYNLVARFTLPERIPAQKTTVKKEFIMVTPNGEVRTLKIE